MRKRAMRARHVAASCARYYARSMALAFIPMPHDAPARSGAMLMPLIIVTAASAAADVAAGRFARRSLS